MRRFLTATLCILLGGVVHASPFPAGTFLYAGTVSDYEGKILGEENDVVIQAVATNGTVIGEARTVRVARCGVNYRLEIPLSDVRCPMASLPGDTLRCVVRIGGEKVYVSDVAFPPVGKANTAVRCNLVLGTDSDGDGVPDAYVDSKRPWLEAYGYEDYDAKGDYDGDGASNYAEYVAGTDPFDPSQYLHLSAATRPDESGRFSLTFEYVGGRLYCVQGASDLLEPQWRREHFSTTSGGAESTTFAAPSTGGGSVTLYLLPEGDARFYQLLVNPENDSLECE